MQNAQRDTTNFAIKCDSTQPGPGPLLIFRPDWGPKGRKKFLKPALPPPDLRVCMTPPSPMIWMKTRSSDNVETWVQPRSQCFSPFHRQSILACTDICIRPISIGAAIIMTGRREPWERGWCNSSLLAWDQPRSQVLSPGPYPKKRTAGTRLAWD